MDHKMSRSPWVIHYDGSSCNGCDIEVLASLTMRSALAWSIPATPSMRISFW